MSQVSNTLLRIGDQFRRGFESRGDAAMQGAEFGLKKAGLERQSRLDALQLPGMKLEQAKDQRGLEQAERLKQPFNPMEIMSGGLGPFSMGVSADKDGVPGIERAGRYAFGAKYDPEKNAYIKEDGSVVTNEEARNAAPKFQEWFAMNFSPYRGARTNRDEMLLKLKELGPDHPDAPAVQQKIQESISLMKNPEWKLQALERTKALVEKLPDDPFGEKTNNLARIDKEIGIVKGEYNTIIKRQQELADADTKHKQAKELKNLEITSADKRAGLERANRLEAARIRAGASEGKFNKGEAEYQDEWAKNKILGTFGLQVDMNGNPAGQVTKEQLDQMVQLGNQLGYEIQAAPGEKVDRPGLFTGDEQMYQIIGINRANLPGRQNYGLGGPRAAQPTPPRKSPLTGQAAAVESKKLIQKIDAGAVNEKQLLDSLLASGQNEVVRNIVAELKARAAQTQGNAAPVDPEALRQEEERRRIEQIEKEREALKRPTDWGAASRFINRNVRR